MGTEQRRVLRLLTEADEQHPDAWLLLRSLAGQDPTWNDGEPTKADMSRWNSARRAVRTLVERGLAEKRTTDYAGTKMAVVRLRREGRGTTPLPWSVEDRLFAHLKLMDDVQNDLLRYFGSRYRKATVSRPPMESAVVFDPDDPGQGYRAVHLDPTQSSDGDWLRRYADLVATADRDSQGAIEKEVQRRVEVELARHSRAGHGGCTSAPEPGQPAQRAADTLSDTELLWEIAELTSLELRDILVDATKDLYRRTRQDTRPTTP
ncbi:hypothetical protein [Saccharothrix violaceirubra]|uniref:Uncharacterized protein n=1 Tax=Saccharothrix violaceirubra TaxID=413306 RepID=A0A7W7WUK8_9PSEU|nr:hypothetical protein [Saccharothrix violaceirubra]MBB4963498.1 hypothetical protein [Saccharothrix violaceirubra]